MCHSYPNDPEIFLEWHSVVVQRNFGLRIILIFQQIRYSLMNYVDQLKIIPLSKPKSIRNTVSKIIIPPPTVDLQFYYVLSELPTGITNTIVIKYYHKDSQNVFDYVIKAELPTFKKMVHEYYRSITRGYCPIVIVSKERYETGNFYQDSLLPVFIVCEQSELRYYHRETASKNVFYISLPYCRGVPIAREVAKLVMEILADCHCNISDPRYFFLQMTI